VGKWVSLVEVSMSRRAFPITIAAALAALAAAGCSDSPAMEPFPVMQAGMGGTVAPIAGATSSGAGGMGMAPAGTGGVTMMPPMTPPMTGAGTGGMVAAGAGGSVAGAGAGGAAGEAGGAGMEPMPMAGILPPVPDTSMMGPFAVTIDMMGGGNTWVFHPTELGKDGLKHPVFVWGTGATSVPSRYTDHFTAMASHGFVIISPNTGSVNGMLLGRALDWILMQNETMGSKFFGKLDPERCAMGGHSLGSVSTFDREATETRLKTTIHIAGGSFDAAGSSKVKTPTAYICGETDFALPNCEVDWENVEDQPTFFSVLGGIDHVGAARAALPGMIAWLRWHLAGEVERKAEFTCPMGKFCMGIWKSQNKNW
jgi:hypothetical protein